jgi:hypothetical protein
MIFFVIVKNSQLQVFVHIFRQHAVNVTIRCSLTLDVTASRSRIFNLLTMGVFHCKWPTRSRTSRTLLPMKTLLWHESVYDKSTLALEI